MSFLGRIATLVGSHSVEPSAGGGGRVLGDFVKAAPRLQLSLPAESIAPAPLDFDASLEAGGGPDTAITLELQPERTASAAFEPRPSDVLAPAIAANPAVASERVRAQSRGGPAAAQPKVQQSGTAAALPQPVAEPTREPAQSTALTPDTTMLEPAATPTTRSRIESGTNSVRTVQSMPQLAATSGVPDEPAATAAAVAGVPTTEPTMRPAPAAPAVAATAATPHAPAPATLASRIATHPAQLRAPTNPQPPRMASALSGSSFIPRNVPARAAPPPPAVHIGNLEIIVEAPAAPSPAAARISPTSGSSFVSRNYLRSW